MNAIAAILVVIYETVYAILKIFMPVFIIIFVLVAIKIFFRYLKYGKVEFDFLKKRKATKFSDIVLDMIKKLDAEIIYLTVDDLFSDFVIIHETGIYLLKIGKYQGLINGTRENETVKNTIKTSLTVDKENPFYYLDQDRDKLSSFLQKKNIKTLLVTNNVVNVSIDNVKKQEVLNLQNFYYNMKSNLKLPKIYTKEEVLKIVDIFKTL